MQHRFAASDSLKLLAKVKSGAVSSVKEAQEAMSHIDPALVAEAYPRAVKLTKQPEEKIKLGKAGRAEAKAIAARVAVQVAEEKAAALAEAEAKARAEVEKPLEEMSEEELEKLT